MKSKFNYVCVLAMATLLFAACSKSSSSPATTSYPTGRGHITGSGGVTFDVSSASTQFRKVVDTVSFFAGIDTTSSNTYKGLTIGMVVKSTGVISFDNLTANPNGTYNTNALALYLAYYGTPTNGQTHVLTSQSGSINVTSFSSNHIEGTYTVTVVDGLSSANGGVAPLTVSGSFSGNY